MCFLPGSLSLTPLKHLSLIWIGCGVLFQSTFQRRPLLPPYWPSASIKSPYMAWKPKKNILNTLMRGNIAMLSLKNKQYYIIFCNNCQARISIDCEPSLFLFNITPHVHMSSDWQSCKRQHTRTKPEKKNKRLLTFLFCLGTGKQSR